MVVRRKWIVLATTGVLVAATVIAGALVAPQATLAASSAAPVEHRGLPGEGNIQGDSYLADALGITTDALATAQEAARVAAIDQALEQGLITQAQADALKENQRFGFDGRRMFGFFGVNADIDQEALLADALGISVERLQEAQATAQDARMAQAVEDGKLTQEQADLMKAEQALQNYLQEKGFFADAVKQAVQDGVITQEQADAILSRQGPGMWGFGRDGFDRSKFGGRGGHGGLRGFPGSQESQGEQSGQEQNLRMPWSGGSDL